MDRIVTVSHDSAREITTAFGVPPEKIRVVYNGLDSEEFAPIPGWSKKPNNLIFVGNSEDRKKGLLYLLQSLVYLPEEVTLTVVDGGAPQRSFGPLLTEKYRIAHRVHFTGKIGPGDLVRHYNSAEVAVVPSLYEGFGFPVLEAMACGVPVLCSNTSSLPEVAGDAAVLVNPLEVDDIARGLREITANEELRRKLIERGYAQAQQFTWQACADVASNVFDSTLSLIR